MQGTIVGERYVLRDSLGHGGMGRVYRASDELLGRDVALKLLKPQHADNEQFVERFRRESKNVAALSHPNIVSIFDAGEDADGSPYMAMEYIGGGTLADRIEKKGPLDSLEAAGIALQVACALEEAHERGVIHRDIKPHNIFMLEEATSSSATSAAGFGGIAPGGVKVGDFGIARAAAETAMTETSLILGTIRYLSPEQATGEAVGPESDLYSLGVVLYEMITGEVPFDAENPIAIAMKHISEPPPLPREKNPGVSEGIQAVTLKLLSKAPEDRYPSALELVEDLERVARGLPPAGIVAEEKTEILKRPPSSEPSRRPARGRGIVTPHRRSRTGRRVGLLAMFAILAAGLALAGTESSFATLYESFNTGSAAQRVTGMENVKTPSAVEAPVTRVNVPGVVGEKEAAAEKTLEDAGLKVEKESRETSDGEAGTVVSQDPQPDNRVQRGSTVTITVARASATSTVPDLNGLSVQQAEARISEAGLTLGQQGETYSDTMPSGLILNQDSTVGAEAPRDANVDVTVSSGPEPAAAVPAPEPESTPAPESESTPAPEPAPAPAQTTEPETASQSAPAAEPAPTPESSTQPTQQPVPVPETIPQPEATPRTETTPEPTPAVESQDQPPDVLSNGPPNGTLNQPPESQPPTAPTPGPAPPLPGNVPASSPDASDSVVPVTPEPVEPTMPDVLGK